jgi:septal ring factor EnvC (AmiA/AmiB activator)
MAEKQFGNSGRREITPGQTPQGERGAGAINDNDRQKFEKEIAKFKKGAKRSEKNIAKLERKIAKFEERVTGLEEQALILLKRIRSQTDKEK